MPNPENLIPAKKGDVRNPKGKKVGTLNRATILKKWLEVNSRFKNSETKKFEIGTVEDKVILSLIAKALKGSEKAIEMILDSKYGKIKETIEIQQEQPLFPDVSKDDSD